MEGFVFLSRVLNTSLDIQVNFSAFVNLTMRLYLNDYVTRDQVFLYNHPLVSFPGTIDAVGDRMGAVIYQGTVLWIGHILATCSYLHRLKVNEIKMP